MSLVGELRMLRERTLFVPEVLQASMMDCGPATLKAVFDGHRRPINLERLRERCQTDVDGTSLSAMAETADRLGLDVAQIMVPKDSLLLPEAECLPAIAFFTNPDGLLHFTVIWNRIGGRVQLMDPGRGRIWSTDAEVLARIATPSITMPAEKWRAWAAGEDFSAPLVAKMKAVGFATAQAMALVEAASSDDSPWSFAALDAATRMVRSLVDSGAIPRGPVARQLLTSAFEGDRAAETKSIPQPYWIAWPGDRPGTVKASGAVLLQIEGLRGVDEQVMPTGATAALRRTRFSVPGVPLHGCAIGAQASLLARSTRLGPENMSRASIWAGPVVPREVMSELTAPTVRPHRVFWSMLWEDSPVAVVLVGCLIVLGMGTGILDALLMRGLSDLVGRMNVVAHRLVAIIAVVVFLILALGLDVAQSHLVQRLARGLEMRLRVAFLEKLPRIEERYFRSRPVSDMASRAHLLQTLRNVPKFVVDVVGGILRLMATTAVLVWLSPQLWKLALALFFVSLALPFVSYRLLDEAIARMRALGATLFRFYLDALLGVMPIRVHGAARTVRREHEAILTEWVRTNLTIEDRVVRVKALERVMGTLFAVGIVAFFVLGGGDLRALLLVAYFAQRLPGDAEALVTIVRRYPLMKHDALRLFEPLAASESNVLAIPARARRGPIAGVDLRFVGATAVAGGRAVIADVNLSIPRGSHVAIVGPSGAGKSSLVGILLGWLFVTEGKILVDGRPLDEQRLALLREETAWIDPAIQLWNATLLDNILYGTGDAGLAHLEQALDTADLLDVVERLPDGLQTPLGEAGARVSGGQGQRVRYGRALLNRDARLVILDEPFRGLEREKRRQLLARARELWSTATILFVSHDVADTLDLDRVIVVSEGAIVEDGKPAELLEHEGGVYRSLVEGDRSALDEVWGKPEWSRLALVDGVIVRGERGGAAP